MDRCIRCHQPKPDEAFPPPNKVRKRHHPICVQCHKERDEEKSWKHNYALTREEYQVRLFHQGGVCAICQKAARTKLEVDHNHQTGRVRGLLCHSCNVRLGKMGEDLLLLQRFVSYLRADLEHKDERHIG